jgi:hypothetical protein
MPVKMFKMLAMPIDDNYIDRLVASFKIVLSRPEPTPNRDQVSDFYDLLPHGKSHYWIIRCLIQNLTIEWFPVRVVGLPLFEPVRLISRSHSTRRQVAEPFCEDTPRSLRVKVSPGFPQSTAQNTSGSG